MKLSLFFASLLGIVSRDSSAARAAQNFNSFSAVTSFSGLDDLYISTRRRQPHELPDETVTSDVKKNICQSITRSGFFYQAGKEPIDWMDIIYKEIKSLSEKNDDGRDQFQSVLTNYDELRENTQPMKPMVGYSYRTILTSFKTESSTERDFAFACLARRRYSDFIDIFYISDPYNMNSAAIGHNAGPVFSARFICLATNSWCDLWAIAEEPAIAYAYPHYPVQDIYRRIRMFYKEAETALDDPVCGLSKADKLRVCACVMNSSHFVDKVQHRPNWDSFEGKCARKPVSFRYGEGEPEAGESMYSEWMLSCGVEPLVDYASFTYFVSRSYVSYHAVVYIQHYKTRKWYVENISANIAVIVERNLVVNEEHAGVDPPNLAEMLKSVRGPMALETGGAQIQENAPVNHERGGL